jgi:hypothetical protein
VAFQILKEIIESFSYKKSGRCCCYSDKRNLYCSIYWWLTCYLAFKIAGVLLCTAPLRQAASAKGTVSQSDIPITISVMKAELPGCSSLCTSLFVAIKELLSGKLISHGKGAKSPLHTFFTNTMNYLYR